MKFMKDGKVFDNIQNLRLYWCKHIRDCHRCNLCDTSYGEYKCREFAAENPYDAAKIMFAEVIEDKIEDDKAQNHGQMRRYKIWNKIDDIITPNGTTYTAEQWKNEYPWIQDKNAQMIICNDKINGRCAMDYNTTVDYYKNAGAEITDDMSVDEVLQAIEYFEDYGNNNVIIHRQICDELNGLYKNKNSDYGNSFTELYKEFGLISVVIRLTDKLNRLKQLSGGKEQKVNNESIKDTLMDLANYAIMAVMECNKDGKS